MNTLHDNFTRTRTMDTRTATVTPLFSPVVFPQQSTPISVQTPLHGHNDYDDVHVPLSIYPLPSAAFRPIPSNVHIDTPKITVQPTSNNTPTTTFNDVVKGSATPFFGSRLRQDMSGTGLSNDYRSSAPTVLGRYTGTNDWMYRDKEESRPFFGPSDAQEPWILGSTGKGAAQTSVMDLDRDRYTMDLNYRDVCPVQEYVGHGIDIGPSVPNAGGFHPYYRWVEDDKQREYTYGQNMLIELLKMDVPTFPKLPKPSPETSIQQAEDIIACTPKIYDGMTSLPNWIRTVPDKTQQSTVIDIDTAGIEYKPKQDVLIGIKQVQPPAKEQFTQPVTLETKSIKKDPLLGRVISHHSTAHPFVNRENQEGRHEQDRRVLSYNIDNGCIGCKKGSNGPNVSFQETSIVKRQTVSLNFPDTKNLSYRDDFQFSIPKTNRVLENKEHVPFPSTDIERRPIIPSYTTNTCTPTRTEQKRETSVHMSTQNSRPLKLEGISHDAQTTSRKQNMSAASPFHAVLHHDITGTRPPLLSSRHHEYVDDVSIRNKGSSVPKPHVQSDFVLNTTHREIPLSIEHTNKRNTQTTQNTLVPVSKQVSIKKNVMHVPVGIATNTAHAPITYNTAKTDRVVRGTQIRTGIAYTPGAYSGKFDMTRPSVSKDTSTDKTVPERPVFPKAHLHDALQDNGRQFYSQMKHPSSFRDGTAVTLTPSYPSIPHSVLSVGEVREKK